MSGDPVGDRALLVPVPDASTALELATWLRSRTPPVALDVVPAARSVLVDGIEDHDRVQGLLAGWRASGEAPRGPLVRVPVHYDGPDLTALAAGLGLTVREVVERHTATDFVSAFCGFAPGFAYLTGWSLPVPRLADPRPRVPAGSVGLAGLFCGVYPSTSPGGWQLLGHTEVTLWDPARDEPALLAPGTRVRFTEAP